MRYIRTRKQKSEEVAPIDRVRMVGSLDVYGGANADDVIRRIRSMTYGSTSSEQVKLRLTTS